MSGGHFDYQQYRLEDIASSIDELIASNDNTELDRYGCEIGRHYPPDIIERFDITRKMLRLAAAMAQRVDWLVSGDDGEDAFRDRWDEEVGPLAETLEYKHKYKAAKEQQKNKSNRRIKMNFLGIAIPERSEWQGDFDWKTHSAYIRCPADNPDDQMQCIGYVPCDANNLQCKYCDCGKSDICSRLQIEAKEDSDVRGVSKKDIEIER